MSTWATARERWHGWYDDDAVPQPASGSLDSFDQQVLAGLGGWPGAGDRAGATPGAGEAGAGEAATTVVTGSITMPVVSSTPAALQVAVPSTGDGLPVPDVPNTGMPRSAPHVAPEVTMPEATTAAEVTGAEVTEMTAAEVTSLEVTAPEVTEVTAPEVTAAEVTAPEVTEMTAPRVPAPEATAPRVTASEVTVPELASRGRTSTALRAPEVTVPQDLPSVSMALSPPELTGTAPEGGRAESHGTPLGSAGGSAMAPPVAARGEPAVEEPQPSEHQLEVELGPPLGAELPVVGAWHIPTLTAFAGAPRVPGPEEDRRPRDDGPDPYRAPAFQDVSESGDASGRVATASMPPRGSGMGLWTLVPLDRESLSARTSGEILTSGPDAEKVAEPPFAPPPGKIVVASGEILGAPPEPAWEGEGVAQHVELVDSGVTELDAEVLDPADLVEPVEELEPAPLTPRKPGRIEAPPPPPRQFEGTFRGVPAGQAIGSVESDGVPVDGSPHWSDQVFEEPFFELERLDARRVAAAEAQFIAEITKIGPGARVIDVGCGGGFHAGALAEQGCKVTALEVSMARVRAAQAASIAKNIQWVHGDVREYSGTDGFDRVLCLGTTLGQYDDAQNLSVLRALRRLCRSDGQVVLQVANRDYVVARLPTRSWWQGDGCLVLDEVDWDPSASRVQVHRTMVFEDGRQLQQAYDLRVYAPHELEQLLTEVGLVPTRLCGGRHLEGRFFAPTSPELWVVARPR